MGKILQTLIAQNDGDLVGEALKLIDGGGMMDPDFKEIYHQIIELGCTAYGAAQAVFLSGASARSMKTLHYHALQIEVNLLGFLKQVTPNSMLTELMSEGKLDCPDELVIELEKLLKENDVEYEKWATYTLISSSP